MEVALEKSRTTDVEELQVVSSIGLDWNAYHCKQMLGDSGQRNSSYRLHLEHDCRAWLDCHSGPPALKAPALVVDEARLLHVRQEAQI